MTVEDKAPHDPVVPLQIHHSSWALPRRCSLLQLRVSGLAALRVTRRPWLTSLYAPRCLNIFIFNLKTWTRQEKGMGFLASNPFSLWNSSFSTLGSLDSINNISKFINPFIQLSRHQPSTHPSIFHSSVHHPPIYSFIIHTLIHHSSITHPPIHPSIQVGINMYTYMPSPVPGSMNGTGNPAFKSFSSGSRSMKNPTRVKSKTNVTES